MPPYAQHVVVRTGRDDWGSRIEDEDAGVEGTGMNFARSLKGLVGRGGKFFDVCMLGFLYIRSSKDDTEQRADACRILARKTHPYNQFLPSCER